MKQVSGSVLEGNMHKARLYSHKDGKVSCELCAHHCTIAEGKRGICGVRENIAEELYTLVYGRLVAEHVDPIEKKPIFHVLPGSSSYSIATAGCNFRCLHCQNASISQVGRKADLSRSGRERTPDDVISAALLSGCRSISYTYVEPTVFFEFAYDCCVLAVERGLKNIFVSNGYMSAAASEKLAPVLTAINIDIKSFSDQFYRKVCGARLQPVLDTVRRMKELGVWVEVTTLLIPGLNDSVEELRQTAAFIAEIDPHMPWHVTAFYPAHKMLEPPPTPLHTLQQAREIGLQCGLTNVYEGNIPGSGGENTYCPSCGKEVVKRYGFAIRANSLVHGCCPKCSVSIAGIWE